MKQIYETICENAALNIFEGLLDVDNKKKVLALDFSAKNIEKIFRSISDDDDMDDVLFDAQAGDNRAMETLHGIPEVGKFLDIVGDRRGILMLRWLTSAIAGMETDIRNSCNIISGYFNKLLKAKNFEKFIGAGMEGFCIDTGDQIIKVYYKNIPSETMKFYKLAKTKRFKALPRVSHLSARTVSMEKLEVVDDLVKAPADLREFCDVLLGNKHTCSNAKVAAAVDELKVAGEELGVKYWDANIWNVGKRANGDLVLFDP